jgi:hypothetical protein
MIMDTYNNYGSLTFLAKGSTVIMFNAAGSTQSLRVGAIAFDTLKLPSRTGVTSLGYLSPISIGTLIITGDGTCDIRWNVASISILKGLKLKGKSAASKFNSVGAQGQLINKTGKPLSISNVTIGKLNVIGPTLYAEKSVNGGNNSNVCFYPQDKTLSRKLAMWFPSVSSIVLGKMNVNGTWKTFDGAWYKVDGSWKVVSKEYTKQTDTWKALV